MADTIIDVTPVPGPIYGPPPALDVLLSTMWGINAYGKNVFQVLPDQDQGDVVYPDSVNINGWDKTSFRFQNRIDSNNSSSQVYLSAVTQDSVDANGIKINPTKKNENGLVGLLLEQRSTDPNYPQSATTLAVVSEGGAGQLYCKNEATVSFARHEKVWASYTYGTGNSKVTVNSMWLGNQGNGMTVTVNAPGAGPAISITGKDLTITPPVSDPSVNNCASLLAAHDPGKRLFRLAPSAAGDGTGQLLPLATSALAGGLNVDGRQVGVQTGCVSYGADAGFGNDRSDPDDDPSNGPFKNYNITVNFTRANVTPIYAGIGIKGGTPVMYTTDIGPPGYNGVYIASDAVSGWAFHYGDNFAVTAPNFPPYRSLPPEQGGVYSPPTQNPYACLILGNDGLDQDDNVIAIPTTMKHFRFPVTVDQTDENTHATTAGVASTINKSHYLGQSSAAVRTEYLTESVIVDQPLTGSEATHKEWTFNKNGTLNVTYKMGTAGLLVGTVGGIDTTGKLKGSVPQAVRTALDTVVTVADLVAALKLMLP